MCEAGAGVKREWKISQIHRFLIDYAKLLVSSSKNMQKSQIQGWRSFVNVGSAYENVMTVKVSRVSNCKPSFVEKPAGDDIAEKRTGHIPRDDVLQYVHEMCVTLAYMSITYHCERMADLLRAAAAKAEQGIVGSDRTPQVVEQA